jgi:hypothetical protein
MVKFFNSIVGFVTVVLVGAFLMIFYIPTLFRLVIAQRSSSIFFIVMIIRALLKIVALWFIGTGHYLE